MSEIDLSAGIAEAKDILEAIETGRLIPLFMHKEYIEGITDLLRDRQQLLQGKVDIRSPHFFEQSPAEQEAELERRKARIYRQSRMETVFEALPSLRRSGWFQHAPLRTMEKQCLTWMFAGRPRISIGVQNIVIICATHEQLGAHDRPLGYSAISCQCPDFYRKKARRQA